MSFVRWVMDDILGDLFLANVNRLKSQHNGINTTPSKVNFSPGVDPAVSVNVSVSMAASTRTIHYPEIRRVMIGNKIRK